MIMQQINENNKKDERKDLFFIHWSCFGSIILSGPKNELNGPKTEQKSVLQCNPDVNLYIQLNIYIQ